MGFSRVGVGIFNHLRNNLIGEGLVACHWVSGKEHLLRNDFPPLLQGCRRNKLWRFFS